MNYWIVKNKSSDGAAGFVAAGRRTRWTTAKYPRALSVGDRLFFWASRPRPAMVGLGRVTDVPHRPKWGVQTSFDVEYLTNVLKQPLDLALLRGQPALADASFLKSGPSGTLFPLTAAQGAFLYRLTVDVNAAVDVWPDLQPDDESSPLIDLDLPSVSAVEGRQAWVTHLRRERSPELRSAKLARARATSGQLACEVCDLRFAEIPGGHGDACCEVHHALPLADAGDEVTTSLDDLHVLCSNCHRMIHRTSPLATVAEMRQIRIS